MNNCDTTIHPFAHEYLDQECHDIANWWLNNSIDHSNGGFFGEVDNNNQPIEGANKGIILNTRILWFFSESARHYSDDTYLEMAKRAYQFLLNFFDDKKHGGVKWELDYKGNTLSDKKQTYAQAFSVFGLAAYFQCTKDQTALDKALSYFDLIEDKTVDQNYGGYLEAFGGAWQPLNDVRLSEKDKNLPKSMNTHIHILEAYTALYRASKEHRVGLALRNLVSLICNKIIDNRTFHLRLFQDFDWKDMSDSFSYGHDIECSWLVWDALNALERESLKNKYKPFVIKMAEICLEQSIGDLGQVCDKYTFSDSRKHFESEWWVQAESLVGFMNAFQLSGETKFYNASEKIWNFTQQQHIDSENGEWSWKPKREQHFGKSMYKAGFWKGPYHNGRAMMETAEMLRVVGAYQGRTHRAVVN
ncbi:AGE family epimerase/isomerase [Paraglaciecola arctica]|uniref:AGE family epimerase/isomerase n=1 Tax=Paraglaciecola arctica TaxID=1128911 RepID=UPI001C06928B|nr:AGE family epimerase/isomerase [Paraglaciecola arctica]